MKVERRTCSVIEAALPVVAAAALWGWFVLSLEVRADDEAAGTPLATYISPSLLETNRVSATLRLNATIDQVTDDALVEWDLDVPRHKLTAAERWKKFEAEFGISENESTGIKGSMEAAKYDLDKATFTVNEWIIYLERAVNFDYELRNFQPATSVPRPRRYYTSPFQDVLDNAHLKSDFKLDVPTGNATLGLRLVLPIGD